MRTIEDVVAQYTPEEIQAIQDEIDRVGREVALLSPFQMLQELYRMTDEAHEEIPESIRQSFSCKRGCAHCCHIKVSATEVEANLALAYAEENNIPVDKYTLEKQKDLSEKEYMFSPHKRCVFLGDNNECKIYPVRPMSCRNYYVSTPSELCNVELYPHGSVASYLHIEASIPAVVMMNNSTLGNFTTFLFNKINNK